jgi:large subunit ribosomal protein L15
MPVRKRKKNTRMRGSHTHGWGDKKKHRGTGHRGGKGNAGSGKRADSKKPSTWALGRFHSMGFISRSQTQQNPINVGDISLMVEHGKFQKKGSTYEVNLTDMGFTKLLSKGMAKYPMHVIVGTATEKAVQKVSAVGGAVVLPSNK